MIQFGDLKIKAPSNLQISPSSNLQIGIYHSLNLKDTAPLVLLVLFAFSSYLLLPSWMIINAVLGGMLPRFSAYMTNSFRLSPGFIFIKKVKLNLSYQRKNIFVNKNQ